MTMTKKLHAPPPVASSISRGSFRDTRVADDFSPFGSIHEFNAATRQVAPSPFLHGIRPGSLHTSVAHGTPMHKPRGIDQTLSRRDSMASFYVDQNVRAPPHPDDVFSVNSGYGEPIQRTPHPQDRYGTLASPQMTMNVQQATPTRHSRILEDDENSVRYGSLYAAPYVSQAPAPPPKKEPSHADMHKPSVQTTGSKLSRGAKVSKRSGFSMRRKPPAQEPSQDGQSQHRGTPFIRHQPSLSEGATRPPSTSGTHHTPHNGTPYTASRHVRSVSERPTRPTSMRDRDSIRSIPKHNNGFPFEQDGDDLIAQVWLPWTDRLNEVPCYFHVDGIKGEQHWLEVDYQWTKMIHGTVKFHNAGMSRRAGTGRGRLIVEWEIAFELDA